MKVLYTADIHIKLGQKNVPVDWSINRFNLLTQEICRLTAGHDLLIIGGDIFDRVPTLEELEIYFGFVRQIPIKCIIYPGNHEATKKSETFLQHLKSVTFWINNKVEVLIENASIHGIDFIPYNRLKQFEERRDFAPTSKILCTHVRGSIPPHVKPEVNLDIFKDWELVLAGDLHSHSNSQLNIVYPGSPVTTSFHRTKVSTGVLSVDTNTLDYTFIPLNLPQLLKKSISSQEEAIPTDFDHTIYELEGSMLELAKIEDSALVSKKLATRARDTALILEPGMTLASEVQDYLTFILQLPEDEVVTLLKELHEFEAKSSSV